MKLADIVKEKIENMDDITYKQVLDNSTSLIRFDIINRLVILHQNPLATDVRSADEWEMMNMQIENPKAIYCLIPYNDEKYYTTKNRRVVGNNELTYDEIIKALEYKLIEKSDNLDSIHTVKMYDISNIKDHEKYSINIEYKRDDLIRLISMLDEENKHTINKEDSYEEIKLKISKLLCSTFIDDDLSENEKKLLKNSINYSVDTLGRRSNTDTQVYSSVEINELIRVLSIIDAINDIIVMTVINNSDINADAVKKVARIQKANLILNIYNAHNVYKRIYI